MKKRLFILLFSVMCTFGFTACIGDGLIMDGDGMIKQAGNEVNDPEEPSDPDITETPTPEPDETAQKEPVVLFDNQCAWAVYPDNSVKVLRKLDDNISYIADADSFGEYMYAQVCDVSSDNPYTFFIYDAEGNEKTVYNVADVNYCYSEISDGKLYLINKEYVGETGNSKIYEFNPETDEFVYNSQYSDVTNKIEEEYDFISWDTTLFDMLKNDNSYVVKSEDGVQKLYDFDISTNSVKSEINLPDEIMNSDYYFSSFWKDRIILRLYEAWEGKTYSYLYNPTTNDLVLLSKENITILYANDKYFYWEERLGKTYNVSSYEIKRYNSETGSVETVMTKEEIPGDSGYNIIPGVTGFTATEDKLYYEDYGTNNVVWKCCNLDGSNEEVLDVVIYEYSWGDYATITVDIVTDFYGDSTDISDIKYGYYIEKPIIKKDVPNADAINKIIDSYYKELTDSALQCREMALSEISDDAEYIYSYSNDILVEDVRRIGEKYLTVELSGYDYMGGAHGMPFNMYHIFNLENGEEIKLRDICGVDEETFRKLVASKTLDDAKNGSDRYKYFISDFESVEAENEFYNDVYKNTSFEAWDISYGEDGIIVEFPPYMYGPFASGFIEIPISYEELGMDMN